MIHFAIIDSVRYETVRYPQFQQFGVYLDKYLKNFYKEEFGTDAGEKYAIALAQDSGDGKSLLARINDILKSQKGKIKLRMLEKKYIERNRKFNPSSDCSDPSQS